MKEIINGDELLIIIIIFQKKYHCGNSGILFRENYCQIKMIKDTTFNFIHTFLSFAFLKSFPVP